MRIDYEYHGKQLVFERDAGQVIIGRPKPGAAVDLDLTPDDGVSRPHARIWIESGRVWLEDLGSRSGTLVAGEKIDGKCELGPGDAVQIGRTTLRVHVSSPRAVLEMESVPTDPQATAGMEQAEYEAGATIVTRLEADVPVFSPTEACGADTARQLALLCELSLQFGGESSLDALLQTIVERLVQAIDGAKRGALLVRDRTTGQLLLKAQAPDGDSFVSRTLARRAIDERQAFIWQRGGDVTITSTELASGMYVPLLWKGEAVGVVALDNCDRCEAFTANDLRLTVAVAQQAAMAVIQHRVQEELQRNAALLGRLMVNFSPKVRDQLLHKASRGIFLGGEKSEVTILVSDIRGFTRLSQGMDATEVVHLLNEYFAALVDAVFRHDGTIDKFVGDAILAVFGSPEPDAKQHEKAVRAAVAMQQAAQAVTTTRRARDAPTCEIGIGVHCGEVLHGFIGSRERMEFTVIGDAVNRAARYCDGAKPGEVLVSPELHQRVWTVVRSERTSIKTKHEGDFPAHRIISLRLDTRG